MDTYSTLPIALPVVEDSNCCAGHWLTPKRSGQLLLVNTFGQQRKTITTLITQWILGGPLYLIAAGEWLPDHDDLRYAVYKYTVAFDEILNNLILARPFTCLQLLDLLIEADKQNKPVLILDFLHLFYNPDVELSLRYFTLEQCCQYAKSLSFFKPVVVLVPYLAVEEYQRFFPLIASIADEMIESEKHSSPEVLQGLLF